jgi:hypothetical protein
MIISGAIIGGYVLPITICALKADSGAHTKWFWGEILTILGGSTMFFIAFTGTENTDRIVIRWSAYVGVAVTIFPSCARAICRRDRNFGD